MSFRHNNKSRPHKKTKRYQLLYPIPGNKIYESRSLDRAVNRCYKEFRNISDVPEGMFSVMDIDDNTEYQFKIKNKRLVQIGGNNEEDLKDITIATESTRPYIPLEINKDKDKSSIKTKHNIPIMSSDAHAHAHAHAHATEPLTSTDYHIDKKIIHASNTLKSTKSIPDMSIGNINPIPDMSAVNILIEDNDNKDIKVAKGDNSVLILNALNKFEKRLDTIEEQIGHPIEIRKDFDTIKNSMGSEHKEKIKSERLDLDKLNHENSVMLPQDPEPSYKNSQEIPPLTPTSSPGGVYRVNIKKLEAFESLDSSEKKYKNKDPENCVIM